MALDSSTLWWEWENVSNQELQFGVFLDNAKYALKYMSEKKFFDSIPDIKGQSIYGNLGRRLEWMNNLWWARKIQLDIIALYILIQNRYDFENLEAELCDLSENKEWGWMRTTDFFEVLHAFRWRQKDPNTLNIEIPSIMKDAIISQRNNWLKPPAKDLQKAVTFFEEEIAKVLAANPEN